MRTTPPSDPPGRTDADRGLDAHLDLRWVEARRRGETLARATLLAAPGSPPRRLLVWPAGHFEGDLGDPRLNQRAALYAEALLDKAAKGLPARQVKAFDGPGGKVEVEFEFGGEAT